MTDARSPRLAEKPLDPESALNWIRRSFGEDGRGFDAKVALITPWLAREVLSLNTKNRKLRPKAVNLHVRTIGEGEFFTTHQGIGLGTDRILYDGQHRLHAIIESDTPIHMLVTVGLPPEAHEAIDRVRARQLSDELEQFHGVPRSATAVAIARMIIEWDNGARLSRTYQAADFQVRKIILDSEDELFATVVSASTSNRHVPIQPSVLGFCYYICGRIDRDDADAFFRDQFIEGNGLHDGDPAKALFRRFATDAARFGKTSFSAGSMRSDRVAYFITAWNHFRSGGRISKLQGPKGGWTKRNFPEPR